MFKKRFTVLVVLLFTLSLVLGCSGPEEKKMKFFNKGKALYEKGDYVKAALEFKNAVQIDPKFADGYYMLGKVAMGQRDFNRAYGSFTKAAQLNPQHWKAQVELGKLFLLARQPDQALEKAEAILKGDPRNVEAMLIKGAVSRPYSQ